MGPLRRRSRGRHFTQQGQVHRYVTCSYMLWQVFKSRPLICEWLDGIAKDFEWNLARSSGDIALRQSFACKPTIELSVPNITRY